MSVSHWYCIYVSRSVILYFMSVSQWYCILCQLVSDIVFYKSVSGIVFYVSQAVALYFMSVSQ